MTEKLYLKLYILNELSYTEFYLTLSILYWILKYFFIIGYEILLKKWKWLFNKILRNIDFKKRKE